MAPVVLALTAAASAVVDATPAGAAVTDELARTGRTIPFLAAGVAVGVALLLRAGASRVSDDERDAPDPGAEHDRAGAPPADGDHGR